MTDAGVGRVASVSYGSVDAGSRLTVVSDSTGDATPVSDNAVRATLPSDDGVSAVEARIVAAVRSGATSWAAVARAAGCSRSHASNIGRNRLGLVLIEAGTPQDKVMVSVRMSRDGRAWIEEEAERDQVTVSEMHRTLLREAAVARQLARSAEVERSARARAKRVRRDTGGMV